MKRHSLLSLPQVLLILIIIAAVLVLPGSDIYTHIHEAWLFNHMMQDRVVLQEDFSMLSGHQPLYGVGVFSYALAGFAWFFFQKATVKVLEVLLFLGIVLLSLKIFKNRNLLLFWYALIFAKVLLPDSYPYLFSMFFFYLGIYLVKRFSSSFSGDIAITLAGLNHPYIAVSNLATIFLGRWLLFLGSVAVLIAQLLVMRYVFFSGTVDFEFDNLLDLGLRTFVLLFPFLIEFAPKLVRRLASQRAAYYATAAGILLLYPILYVPFEMGWQEGISCYYTKSYSEIPQLPGNVRIVDDCRNWIYAFPVKGIITSLSPYYEGQYYQHKWEEAEYLSYLSRTNTSYVVFCKDCEIKTKTFRKTGEIGILEKNFPAYAELKDYVVFEVVKEDKGQD
ncbi:hypothetical protein HYU17_04270 [Candidatus Woesearchaeota archaeon]|nr:hypothetical protein [Candidatus Woesearchaeota archaeon]